MIQQNEVALRLLMRVFGLEHLRGVREINVNAAYDGVTLINVEMLADTDGLPDVTAETVKEQYIVTVKRAVE